MHEDLDFLKNFPKDKNGLYIVYELFTFDNLFRLLLKNDFDYEDGISFILANCSLSAIVFQERIHNKQYKKLSEDDALSPDLAAMKAKVIHDFMSIAKKHQ